MKKTPCWGVLKNECKKSQGSFGAGSLALCKAWQRRPEPVWHTPWHLAPQPDPDPDRALGGERAGLHRSGHGGSLWGKHGRGILLEHYRDRCAYPMDRDPRGA